tara:strand:- start:2567 stop:3487 length:921 start_codon:yes stop_codon:yes gene_type:complete
MSTSITTTYAGEFAGKYISAALLSADTIEGGGITVKPNVKYKEVMKTLSTNALVKDAACDFADQSVVTLAERILQPEEFQVNLELCKKDFRSDWEAIEMGYSAFDTLPPSFADFLLGHIAAKVAQKTESNIWQGATANAGEFDGFTALLAADATVIDVVGTTVTAANVIAELGKVVDAIPTSVYGKEDLYIYVSQSIARAYVRALGGFGANGLGANGVNNAGTTWFNGGDLAFDGVKLFVCSGMPDNDMVAAEKSNLFFGTGLLSDHNEVKLIDMADLDGSQNVRVVMRFTAGVQTGIGADIVYYT